MLHLQPCIPEALKASPQKLAHLQARVNERKLIIVVDFAKQTVNPQPPYVHATFVHQSDNNPPVQVTD